MWCIRGDHNNGKIFGALFWIGDRISANEKNPAQIQRAGCGTGEKPQEQQDVNIHPDLEVPGQVWKSYNCTCKMGCWTVQSYAEATVCFWHGKSGSHQEQWQESQECEPFLFYLRGNWFTTGVQTVFLNTLGVSDNYVRNCLRTESGGGKSPTIYRE